jgi:hypothetical protein
VIFPDSVAGWTRDNGKQTNRSEQFHHHAPPRYQASSNNPSELIAMESAAVWGEAVALGWPFASAEMSTSM